MAFIVREGSVVAANSPPGAPSLSINYLQSRSLASQSYGWIYSHQPNIRTIVHFLARNIAQLKLKTYKKVSLTDRQEINDHPLAVLLQSPNPYDTPYRLMQGIISDRAIYDVAYLLKVRSDDGSFGLVRLPPEKVELVGDNWLYPEKFRLLGDKAQPEYTADQVVYFRGYNPQNNVDGTSAIESLRDYLVEEYNANKWRDQTWRNQARISGYLTRPADAGKWKPEDKERFARSWRAQYTGDGPNAGGTPVLEDGMAFVPAAFTPEQAQYIEARKLTREECANAYHIPPPMVGILDHASFSNITEQHKMLYQDTLGPWLSEIEQEVRLQLLPEFEAGPLAKKIYVEFNIQEKLDGSFTEQAESLSTATGSPWLTPNEARARQNLPSIDGGDDLVTPLNVTKGGQASPQDGGTPPPAPKSVAADSAPPTANPTPPKSVDDFIERQRQVLASKLGAKGISIDEVYNADRWKKELGDI